ncbi:MAG: DNA mismatch repair endonuclease MutL [Bacteroidetes bacterium]|nr:DNA mismatch repair endonuclease MutL [Bacteroidota bacterium]MBU1113894.1 DNA mismatch repair endonuclease MutL [Bacteroidota bacterium]MBU1798080.1 DNA mismatch repair endonuclease MutL [Bacteroidota bacterium]
MVDSENKIKILPNNIANKIAAGEVVQRPASVLKELLENSIDAEANNIEVFIKAAGKTLIQVVDDGYGMTESDALESFKRHATSKIFSINDLEEIRTFGFRGEALSSITSVAKVEIKTSQKNSNLGTHLFIEESDNVIIEKGNYPIGTSISVKNLFYNTPGRRKFLKTNSTELKHITDTFKRIALSYPAISFKFWNNDDLTFNFVSASMEERVKQVVDENILNGLIEVEENTEYLSIKGYVAKPTYMRKSKGEQFLFINKRFVVSKIINHAVFTAYDHLLDKGEYPFFILFIDLDPKMVDINVHPAKMEIKFDDERSIYNFVKAIIRKSIGQYDLVPNISFNDDSEISTSLRQENSDYIPKGDFNDRPFSKSNFNQKREKQGIYKEEEIDLLFSTINPNMRNEVTNRNSNHPFEENVYQHSSNITEESGEKSSTSFLIALHNKYILSPIRSGLMVIDQHVAHERILYDKAINSFDADMPFSQQLLFTEEIKLDPADYELLKTINPYLVKLGFEIKFKSKNVIVILGVPPDVKSGSEAETLKGIISEYRINEEENHLEERDNLAKSFSCKTAIKAGDKLREQEMRALVDHLFATSMPYVCPHGRPIIIKIPLTEFDKRFGRT